MTFPPNSFPRISFPRKSFPRISFPRNSFPRIHFPEFISQNLFPRIHFPEFISPKLVSSKFNTPKKLKTYKNDSIKYFKLNINLYMGFYNGNFSDIIVLSKASGGMTSNNYHRKQEMLMGKKSFVH